MQFLCGVAQPVVGPSPGEQPMKGMHQVVTGGLPLCKKNIEACILDEVRHVVVKVGREAPRQS